MNEQLSQPSFTVSEVITEARKRIQGNWARYFCLLGLTLLMSAPAQMLEFYANDIEDGGLSALAQILSFFVAGVITIALSRFALEVVDGKRSEFWSLYSMDMKLYLSMLAATLLYTLAVMLGLIALIIPGVILALMFSVYTYVIVEKQVGPLVALQTSRELTQGNKLQILAFWALMFFITLAIIGVPVALSIAAAIFLTSQGAAGITAAIVFGLLGVVAIVSFLVYLGAIQMISMGYMYRKMTETRKIV